MSEKKELETCPTCHGSGKMRDESDILLDVAVFHAPLGFFNREKTCTACGGSGKVKKRM